MKKLLCFIFFLMFHPTGLFAQEVSYTTTGISSDPDITTPQYSSTKMGLSALGAMNADGDNTANGNSALQNLKGIEGFYFNGTAHGNGEHNIAFGSAALQNLDATNCSALGIGCASYNVAVGVAALDRVNPTGSSGSTAKSDTAVGDHAGAHISYGSYDSMFGADTGQSETTGTGNTIIGAESLTTVAIPANGNYNTGVGSFGWGSLSSGSLNVGIGDFIFQLLSTGSDNVALGDGAAGKLTTGNDNVIIGPGVATTTLSTGSSNILIGTSPSADTPTAGKSNWLSINNAIFGDMSGLNFKIGGSNTLNTGAVLDLSSQTNSLLLPTGTTGTRPSATDGMIRYNTDAPALEARVNGAWRSLPSLVATADATGSSSNIGAAAIVTPSANTMYSIRCMEVVTTAASISSTLPSCFVSYTDVDSNISVTQTIASTNTGNIVGATQSSGGYFFYAKSGIAVQIGTSGYLSSAAGMQYAVHVKLEQVQ